MESSIPKQAQPSSLKSTTSNLPENSSVDNSISVNENPDYRYINHGKQACLEDYVAAYGVHKQNVRSLNEAEGDEKDLWEEEVMNSHKRLTEITENYQQAYGNILNKYICGDKNTAVLITEKKETGFWGRLLGRSRVHYFSQYELGEFPEIEMLLVEIDFLAAESTRLLRGKNLNRCLGLIYKVARNTLGLLDSIHNRIGMPERGYKQVLRAKGYRSTEERVKLKNEILERSAKLIKEDKKISDSRKVISQNIKYARRYHEKAAKFSAQKDYLSGNIVCYIVLVLFTVLATTGFLKNTELGLTAQTLSQEIMRLDVLACIGVLAGSLGAIISVMNRISSGDLTLNHEPDSRTIWLIGVFRPLIGGVFGAIILILLVSEFSIFELGNTGGSKTLSTFIILGFIAGFFERFVPDILAQTKNQASQATNGNNSIDSEIKAVPSIDNE